MEVESVYKRLSNFFKSKGEAPLSQNEVTVCLEWLNEARPPHLRQTTTLYTTASSSLSSSSAFLSFATPKPNASMYNSSSIKKKAELSQQPVVDMTPVKRQIQELLSQKSLDVPITEEMPLVKQKVLPEVQERAQPVIMTRTAKTILDALDNPKPTTSCIDTTIMMEDGSEEEESFKEESYIALEQVEEEEEELPEFIFNDTATMMDEDDYNLIGGSLKEKVANEPPSMLQYYHFE